MKVEVSETVSLPDGSLCPPMVVVKFEHQPAIGSSAVAVRFARVRQVYASNLQVTAQQSAAEKLSRPPVSTDAPATWHVWISPEAEDPEAVRQQIIATAIAIANL